MNAELLYQVYQHTIPAAFDLLPSRMDTPEAKAMILAIGLQESRFQHRVQVGGPAHGFWQFEKGGGVRGVINHVYVGPILVPVLQTLRYRANEDECYQAIVHNDVLACVFARLFLWTGSGRLPLKAETTYAWSYYNKVWRPGRPHPETWEQFYHEAWRVVTEE